MGRASELAVKLRSDFKRRDIVCKVSGYKAFNVETIAVDFTHCGPLHRAEVIRLLVLYGWVSTGYDKQRHILTYKEMT